MMQVDVGNFLRLKSCVLYTEHDNSDEPLVNVEVVAHVTKPEHRSSEVCTIHILHNFSSDTKFSCEKKSCLL